MFRGAPPPRAVIDLAVLASRAAAARAGGADAAQAEARAAAAELAVELPRRLHRLVSLFDKLPDSVPTLSSVARIRDSCEHIAIAVRDAPLAGSDTSWESCAAAASALAGADARLAADLAAVMVELSNVKGIAKERERAPDPALVGAADRVMGAAWPAVTASRVLVQHFAVACELGAGGSDARPPPARSAAGVADRDVAAEVSSAVREATALHLEKHGVTPGVTVELASPGDDDGGGAPLRMACLPGHPWHLTLELVKNGMGALHRRHGIDVDEAPPLVVTVAADAAELAIRVVDHGDGIGRADRASALRFFHSTAPYEEPSGMNFSGNFGGELDGRGVGLPTAQAIARFYRGGLDITGLPGRGTEVTAVLARAARV